MLTEKTLREAISVIESHYSSKGVFTNKGLAEKLGIDPDQKEFKQLTRFVHDYEECRYQKTDDLWWINKSFSEHQFNARRIIRNGLLSASLGVFFEPQLYAALGVIGTGMAGMSAIGASVTLLDEKLNKGTMDLSAVFLSTYVGGLLGCLFNNAEMGAGIGAVLSTGYQVTSSALKKRKITSHKPKEEHFRIIEETFNRNVEKLLALYIE